MPVITIAQTNYCAVESLAESVAERLDYPCIGREVIHDAALEFNVVQNALEAALAKPPSLWERLRGQQSAYVQYFRTALCEHVVKGNLVHHGYAGSILLAGIDHVIKLLVVAPLDYRVQIAMDELGVDRQQALARIHRDDKERANWVRFMYGADWHDPALYDAVLNTARLGVPGARDLVCQMSQMERFQPTPASLKALRDLTLGSQVWAVLSREGLAMQPDVQVTADDGIITIVGTAWSGDLASKVTLVASSVPGVRDVVCHLEYPVVGYAP
jgi:cytidylate kinase